jgi:hypothetical protein
VDVELISFIVVPLPGYESILDASKWKNSPLVKILFVFKTFIISLVFIETS